MLYVDQRGQILNLNTSNKAILASPAVSWPVNYNFFDLIAFYLNEINTSAEQSKTCK